MAIISAKSQAPDCTSCALRSRQLCRAVRESSHGFADPSAIRFRRIDAETRLHEEDEPLEFAAILRRGYLRTERILGDGRRSVLGFLAPGDLIGLPLGHHRGPALVAATEADICSLELSGLRRVLQEDAGLAAHFLSEVMKQHTRQLEMVWRRGALNSRERIVAFMVMVAEFMPIETLRDGSVILTIAVSRKDWSDFSNTTVETISRTLTHLADKGMVETVAPSRYRVRDMDALKRLAGVESVAGLSAMLIDRPADQAEVPPPPSPTHRGVAPRRERASAARPRPGAPAVSSMPVH